MANINFGLLDTQYPEKLANAFIRSPEQQNANMLQVMQMQQLMDQREQAQYALGKSRREDTGMTEFGNAIKALGPNPDPLAIAQVFIKHPNPEYQLKGFELQRQAQESDLYAKANAPASGPAFGGVAPAASAPGSFGAEVATRKAQLFAPPPDRTNMMPGAAAALGEVNNLPAVVTPPQVKTQIDFLRERIDANLALGTDRGYKTAENLQKQLTELNRRYPLGNVLMSGTGAIVGTAPQLPQQPRQPNLAADLLIPGPNGTMIPNQTLIGVKTTLAEKSRPPAQPRPEQPPVAVVDPLTGKTVYVSREEALSGRMTPASATEGLSPKEIQKREAALPAATSAVNGFDTKAKSFIKYLIALRDDVGLDQITGPIYGRIGSVSREGSRAQARYDKIVAKGGFQALQDLRDASKTGGALGNVSNQEGKQLTASFAAIDRRQNAADVQAAIDQAISDIEGARTRTREAYDSTYSYKTQAAPSADKPALSPADQKALAWAAANPNDPRAAQIRQKNGVK